MDEVETHKRTPLDELIGAVVADRFRVESVLGVGSMGVVFRARSLGSDERPVALKVVLPDPRHQRSLPRLLRGARLAAQVKHPHVVETLAHGRVGAEREGYFVAMELVDGVPLGRLINAELDMGTVCTLMCQVLDALAHMHARGVLHRDIKPDNVLVSRTDSGHLVCKISDFGIAADLVGEATHLTQPGMTIGTPVYMAPEQMEGKGLDTPAIDLYPVGVMLYEFLGGQLPFLGGSMTALMAKMTRDAPPLVAREGLVVPPELREVVMRLLARRPQERYLMAADARKALEPFCGPALASAGHWEEMAWAPRAWDASDLPAGWGQGRVLLAAGTGQGAPAPVAQTASDLPLVGREDVLEAIERIAGEAEEGQGRAVLLTGGVGLGKSVLMNEVATRLSASGRFLSVRLAFPPGGNAREGLRQALEGTLGTTGRSALHVKQVIKDLLRRHGENDPQEQRDLVTFLRPAGSDRTEQGHMFALVHRCLRRFSRSRPVLLCADDIHRGGPDAAAFLEFLLFQAGFEPFPMLVMGTLDDEHRKDVSQTVSERLARFEGASLHTMPLAPLDEATLTRALVNHLGASRSRARQIARRAAGNPLFALYMARATATGHGTTGERRATLEERVPRALNELLAVSLRNRLARTADPDHYRTLLEGIAILGTAVDLALVEAFLADEVPPSRIDRDLDVCLDLGLLQWSEAGEAELVSFVPEVLRDVLLGGLNPRRARRLHRRAIDVRKEWAGDRVDAEAGALGDHCQAAGRHDEAVDWWLRGQRYELAGGNALRGIEWGLKALAALTPEDERYGACAVSLGRTLLDVGDLTRAAEVLRPVAESADADLAMRAGDVLGDVYENQGAREEWTRLIERLSAREAEASPAGRRALYLARTLWMNSHGRPQEGARDARRALAEAEPGEQAQRAAQRLAFSQLALGELEECERMARRALEESGDRLDLRLRSLRTLGIATMFQGRVELATRSQQELLQICRRSGLVARIPPALCELGDTLRMQGDLEAARRKYQDAERAAQELGLATLLALVHIRQLTCDLQQGRTEGLVARLREVGARSVEAGFGMAPSFCALLETWAHSLDGQVEEALDAYERVENPREIVIDPCFVDILTTTAEGLARAVETRGAISTRADAAIRDLLEVASSLAHRFGASDHAARRQAILDRLPPVQTS